MDKMILEKISLPISIINVCDLGIQVKQLSEKLRGAYSNEYDWDLYLHRQEKIEYLKKNLTEFYLSNINSDFWTDFYTGKINSSDLSYLVDQLEENKRSDFLGIRKKRKRLISEYILEFINDKCIINRVPANSFSQNNAVINNNSQDYRMSNRIFKELPNNYEDDYLYEIIKCMAKKIINVNKNISKLKIIIHHTLVYSFYNCNSTNSPEGIHQDGMDYIVSALVVERKNITGGKSIVYGKDSKTKILEVTLQDGQGILQPDKGSDLWHTVTPCFFVKDKSNNYDKGYRSTIGLDISIIR